MATTHEELMAELKAMEEETVVPLSNGTVTLAQLREVFEVGQNPEDWKAPWAAWVPAEGVEVAMKAIEWFHGSSARAEGIQEITGRVLVTGPGYAAW